MKIPIVTIVGKPNVGKSTFFNRIVGKRIAITAEEAGTTRDRIFYRIVNPEMDFFLVDTGGVEFGKTKTTIEDNVQAQARIAIEESDFILFMANSKEEFTSADFKVAELLRKKAGKKPVLLVSSKCDHPLDESRLANYYAMGLGDPFPISALHNTGIDHLVAEVIKKLKERHFLIKTSKQYLNAVDYDKSHLNIALTGKPNVGKSSIINALLNQEKLIVSEIPGTTRDVTDSLIRHRGKDYNFIDTAGIRRRGKIEKGIEKYSVLRTLSAIERCDVALLLIDSSQPISHQDLQNANVILQADKGLVVLANKWDIKTESEMSEEKRRLNFIQYLQSKFSFLPWAPVIFTSAITKKNLSKIFDQLDLIKVERQKRISTAKLNHFIEEVVEKHKPTGTKRIQPKIFYITQVGINPPHFVFFVNKKKYFHFSYLRYLENQLREQFGFRGTSIVIEFQEKERRYA